MLVSVVFNFYNFGRLCFRIIQYVIEVINMEVLYAQLACNGFFFFSVVRLEQNTILPVHICLSSVYNAYMGSCEFLNLIQDRYIENCLYL